MTPLEKLHHRWYAKTGEQMPLAIARLAISTVLDAVERTEAGETVFVPGVPVTRRVDSDGIQEWDRHKEF